MGRARMSRALTRIRVACLKPACTPKKTKITVRKVSTALTQPGSSMSASGVAVQAMPAAARA